MSLFNPLPYSSPFALTKGEGGEEVRGYNQNISAIKKILSGKNRALTKQLKKDMGKSDKIYSNMLGEDRYESLQKRMDKQKRR